MFASLEVIEKELVVLARGIHTQENGVEHGHNLHSWYKKEIIPLWFLKCPEWKPLPIGHRSNLFTL